jgi:prepilin signal peptidase PulO-like enzyme (type II secretory pathway)
MTWLVALFCLGLGWFVGAAICRAAAWLLERRGDDGPGVVAIYGARHRLYVQIATALAAAALWLRCGLTWPLVPAIIITLLLLVIAAVDLERRLVLNELVLAGAILALGHAALAGWPTLMMSLLGGLVGLALFAVAAVLGRGALGAGDVKLAGLLGLVLGYPAILQALFLTVVIGGITAGILLVTRKVERRTMIPYAPFLAAGGILGLILR